MKVAESKTPASQTKTNSSFFQKKSEQSFFRPGRSDSPFFPKPSSRVGPIQTKLTVGQPNDIYEKEADAMADKVVQRMSEPGAAPPPPVTPLTNASFVQEKCAHCEQEEQLQMKPIFESEAEPVQRNPESSGPATASPSIEKSLQASKGSGSPLPNATRQQMESGFGADFSGVRVHDDTSARQMSKGLNAQAFTHGNDIYFNSGKYDINSKGGKHLLAHELTHVVQQSQGISRQNISKKDISIQRSLSTLCNAPSSWGMPPPMWITLGMLAHLIGMNDYLTKTGGTRGVDVYLDSFDLLPIDPAYAAFIIAHNPSLGSVKQVFLSITPLKRPDYMIDRPGLTEFDELKPDSIPGVLEGMEKIYEIAAYMKLLGLPYTFGTAYIPTSIIPLFSTSLGGVPVNVSLKFTRKRSGLIVYELCIETDWTKVAKAALIALIVIILIIIFKKFPMPAPPPVPVPAVAENGEEQDPQIAKDLSSPQFTVSSQLSSAKA